MTQRGVSPVVGLALLIGATALVAVGVLFVASAAIDQTADAAQQRQTTTSMQTFADKTQDLTNGASSSDEVRIEGYDSGSTVVDESAGRLEVTVRGNGSERTVFAEQLGVLRYRTPDGTTLAYQGGGVWRAIDDHVRIVRPPQLNYGEDPRSNASSLTLPLTTIRGNATETGSFDGEITVQNRTAYYPNEGRVGPIDGDYLEVTVESEYAAGWESYLRSQTPAGIDESHDAGVSGRVVANFTVVDLNETNRTVPGNTTPPSTPNPNSTEVPPYPGEGAVNGPSLYMEGGNDSRVVGGVNVDNVTRLENSSTITGPQNPFNQSFPDIDDELENVRDERSVQHMGELNQGERNNDSEIDTGGVYGYEEVHLTQNNLTVSADDRVVIIVNNSFTLSGGDSGGHFFVTGDGNVTVFVEEGDVRINSKGSTYGNPGNPDQVQVKSGGDLDVTGQSKFYGVLWAPHGVATVDGQSYIEGSILAQRTEVRTGEIEYHDVAPRRWAGGNQSNPPSNPTPDPSPSSTSTSHEFDDPGVGYLHVSETVVEVDE